VNGKVEVSPEAVSHVCHCCMDLSVLN